MFYRNCYPSNEEVRDKIMSNYFNKAKIELSNDNNTNVMSNKRNVMTKGTSSHMSSNTSHAKNIAEMDNKILEKEIDNFSEEEDFIIQEKYSRELLDKYKLTVPEVNEGYALVNKESRKLICNDIMETTIYNIISEAVYGETDLTEKTRIYFFNK